jgi:prepilin-type N-terminal cleavage/methylation domain-containing protein
MLLLKRFEGFTIVELTVVIVILGILAGLTYSVAVPRYRERTFYTRMTSEMNTMGNGMTLYVAKYNDYPPDVSRDVPGALKEFLQGQYLDSWPDAPYPNSVYDYDNWPPDSNGPQQTYQISMRMCNAGDDAGCKANAQKYLSSHVSASVLNNWDSYSSVYYCFKGSCRSHQDKPMNHPGYCINCGNKSQIF